MYFFASVDFFRAFRDISIFGFSSKGQSYHLHRSTLTNVNQNKIQEEACGILWEKDEDFWNVKDLKSFQGGVEI